MRFTRVLRERWYAEMRRALGGQAMEVLVRLKCTAHQMRACSAEGVAAMLGWEGDAQALVEALARAGLLEAVKGGWSARRLETAPAAKVNGHGANGRRANGARRQKPGEQDLRVWYGVLSQRIQRAERMAQEAENEEEQEQWQRQARRLRAHRERLQRAQADWVLDRLQQPVLTGRHGDTNEA